MIFKYQSRSGRHLLTQESVEEKLNQRKDKSINRKWKITKNRDYWEKLLNLLPS